MNVVDAGAAAKLPILDRARNGHVLGHSARKNIFALIRGFALSAMYD